MPEYSKNFLGANITPQERESGQKSEIYKGAPQNEYESALFIGENPVFEQAVTFLEQYPVNQKKHQVQPVVNSISNSLLKDFENLSSYFDYWNAVNDIAKEQEDKETQRKSQNLRGAVIETFTKGKIFLENIKLGEEDLNPIDLVLSEIVYGHNSEAYEAILRGVLNSAKNQDEIVDILYLICESAVKTNDDQMITYALRLLSYDTDIFNQNFKGTESFLLSLYSTNDKTLKKAIEIDSFVTQLLPYYLPKEVIDQKEKINHSYGDALAKYLTSLSDPNKRIKMKALIEYYDEIPQVSAIAEVKPHQWEKYPYSLFLRDPGPVINFTQRRKYQLDPKFAENPLITLPDGSSYTFKKEPNGDWKDIREYISNIYGQESTEKELDINQASTIVSYLRDEIKTVVQLPELRNLKNSLIKNLQSNFKRPLSSRGNEIRITDEKLKSYGYSKIIFRNSDPKKGEVPMDTQVQVYVGKSEIKLILDKNYQLIEPSNRELLNSKPMNANSIGVLLMETWILGHLEELLCTEEERFTENNLPKSYKEDFKKGYIQRVGHLRTIQSENFQPSYERRALAMEENPNSGKKWDLYIINKRRAEQGLHPVTYVRKTEVENSNKSPVIMYADRATDNYRKVL